MWVCPMPSNKSRSLCLSSSGYPLILIARFQLYAYSLPPRRHDCTYCTLSVTIISRGCIITSDLLLLGITWSATYKTSREIKALNHVTSLSSVLFRDGP